MKITADTNFLISATQWNYSVAFKLLALLIKEKATIFITKEIIEEFAGILQRDFGCSQDKAQEFVNKVMSFTTLIEPVEKIDAIKEDPEDNKILECAIASDSEYIITYDVRHLLSLKEFRGIKIIKPEEMFGIIDSS
jgi:putative PIN family toxin of toxin-antitoxin system